MSSMSNHTVLPIQYTGMHADTNFMQRNYNLNNSSSSSASVYNPINAGASVFSSVPVSNDTLVNGAASASGSGQTTPISFLGAFSSAGASPSWYDGAGNRDSGDYSSNSSVSGMRSRNNSVTDALQLLLQSISLPNSPYVPLDTAQDANIQANNVHNSVGGNNSKSESEQDQTYGAEK